MEITHTYKKLETPSTCELIQKHNNRTMSCPGAKKIKVSHQRVPPARPSASKYKSDPKEQQITNEAVSKRNGCAGLQVAKVKDKDLIT